MFYVSRLTVALVSTESAVVVLLSGLPNKNKGLLKPFCKFFSKSTCRGRGHGQMLHSKQRAHFENRMTAETESYVFLALDANRVLPFIREDQNNFHNAPKHSCELNRHSKAFEKTLREQSWKHGKRASHRACMNTTQQATTVKTQRSQPSCVTSLWQHATKTTDETTDQRTVLALF